MSDYFRTLIERNQSSTLSPAMLAQPPAPTPLVDETVHDPFEALDEEPITPSAPDTPRASVQEPQTDSIDLVQEVRSDLPISDDPPIIIENNNTIELTRQDERIIDMPPPPAADVPTEQSPTPIILNDDEQSSSRDPEPDLPTTETVQQNIHVEQSHQEVTSYQQIITQDDEPSSEPTPTPAPTFDLNTFMKALYSPDIPVDNAAHDRPLPVTEPQRDPIVPDAPPQLTIGEIHVEVQTPQPTQTDSPRTRRPTTPRRSITPRRMPSKRHYGLRQS